MSDLIMEKERKRKGKGEKKGNKEELFPQARRVVRSRNEKVTPEKKILFYSFFQCFLFWFWDTHVCGASLLLLLLGYSRK